MYINIYSNNKNNNNNNNKNTNNNNNNNRKIRENAEIIDLVERCREALG